MISSLKTCCWTAWATSSSLTLGQPRRCSCHQQHDSATHRGGFWLVGAVKLVLLLHLSVHWRVD